MNNKNNRLFNYTKLLADIQKESKKTQEELSAELDCTASHISNVKNGKSTFSLDKTLHLLNQYEYCIEDYLKDETGMEKQKEREEYKEWMQDIDVELQLLLIEQVELMVKLNYEKTEEKCADLSGENRTARISENIHRIRTEKGILVKEMCECLELKDTTYRNIENGSNRTTIDNYACIAKIFCVPLTLLLEAGLKNKEALVAYRLEKIFSKVNFVEKRKIKKMIEEMAGVLKKYRINGG